MTPTIELSMIVKNGAAGLERCLRSARPFVDRIVMGDTGSTDASRQIARGFDAEVVAIPWEEDFARARNRVLALRQCDWTLVLDADEMIDARSGTRIRELAKSVEIAAFHNPRWNYMRDASMRLGFESARPNPPVIEESRAYPAFVPLPTTRLFRSRAEIYYEGCVHETVTHRVAAMGLKSAAADFVVHHFGHAEDADDDRQRKNDLYQVLSERKLAQNANDPQAYIDVGFAELENARRPKVALQCFERAGELSADSGVAWLFSGLCLVRLGRLDEALERLARAARLGMRNAVYFQAMGDAHFHGGRHAEALAAYTRLESMGEASPLSEAKRGACEVRLGASHAGIRRMRRAVDSAPAFAELYDILSTGALLGGEVKLAAETAEARLALGKTTEFHLQLASLLKAQLAARGRFGGTAGMAAG